MRTLLTCLFGAATAALLPAQLAQYTTFGSGCSGSMSTTSLIAQDVPLLGHTLQVDLDNLPANVAFMVTGYSSSTSPLGSLPLPLGPFGMPGCSAWVSPDAAVLVSGAGNQATFAFAIPADPGLGGVQFFQQALVLDAGASNVAGFVVSDAAAAVVGLAGWPSGGTPVANMAPIGAGSFQMGSTNAGWRSVPVHTVTLTHPFWMGKHEVTQAEYQAVMATNPSYFTGPTLPVESVSWNDATAYCSALTAQEAAANRLPPGYAYRLPTEAEWEYCCRAGTTTLWNVGNNLTCSHANFAPPPVYGCVFQTSAVGSYTANAWGLHDMHGNVMEWCLDSWDQGANYPSGPVADPYVNSGSEQIWRGGSWTGTHSNCKSAMRGGHSPVFSSRGAGFRIVLAPV